MRGLLLDEIARLKREGVDEELFTLCKNQLYGELVQDLENIEDVAGALASSFFRGRTPADEIETLASVTLSDVNGALRAMLCTERSATVIIRPGAVIRRGAAVRAQAAPHIRKERPFL